MIACASGEHGKGRARVDRPGDEGSVLVLTLGYVLLALAVVLVCVCATDLHLAQKRLDALAASAAAAGADGYTLEPTADGVRAVVTDDGVREQAALIMAALPVDARLVSAEAPDGVSARVTLSATWHPPLIAPFVPDGVELRAVGTGRTALQ